MSYTSFDPKHLLPLVALLFLAACEKPERSGGPVSTTASPEVAAPALHPAATAGHAVAFYEAVPFAMGALKATQFPLSIDAEGVQSAIGTPATFWPDGSVQWLRVEGIAPEGITKVKPLVISTRQAVPERSAHPMSGVEVLGEEAIVWTQSASGEQIVLRPEASLLRISKPKPEPSTDPEWLDREGQYAWSMPHRELTEDGEPIPLQLRVREQVVEMENSLYRVVRFRGDGGASAPGNGLEWQLRMKVYHALPLIRAEMTWAAQWDVTEYTLVSAKWTLENRGRWNSFATLEGMESPTLLIQNDHRGGGSIAREGGETATEEDPSPGRDGLVAVSHSGNALAIGVRHLSRLGPNHLSGNQERVEIANWSEYSGHALDLRRSTSREDYGTSGVDLKWHGRGVSRTLYTSFALCSSASEAAALARHEAVRDYLWFADVGALGGSQALGPYSAEVVERNRDFFSGLQANLHFLRASRDYWRWNGWANFGDIRTNHALGDTPARGLHAGRWALNGRYGWRNASGEISAGFLQIGMLLGDRPLILAGLDNAEHIVDVDAFHGSFFIGNKGKEGGLRRRNRDHWSGDVQPQYCPNKGLYISQWLSGDARIADTLQGLRAFASRGAPGNSVFPAAAWLYHYQETHDPAALAEANRLLDLSVAWWKRHAETPLDGLASLYAGNFRRVSDGAGTLIAFHKATHDPRYLRAIEESARMHPIGPQSNVPVLSHLYELAYLRSQGVAGLPDYTIAPARLAEYIPSQLPSPEEIRKADYARLREMVTTQLPPAGHPMYRESASIGGRAATLPLLLEQFGHQTTPSQQPLK